MIRKTLAGPLRSGPTEHAALHRAGSGWTAPRPRWPLLYAAMIGGGAAGFFLLLAVPHGFWQEVVEVATVVGLFGAMMAWARLNRVALGESEGQLRPAGSPLVRRVIRSRPVVPVGSALALANVPKPRTATVIRLTLGYVGKSVDSVPASPERPGLAPAAEPRAAAQPRAPMVGGAGMVSAGSRLLHKAAVPELPAGRKA
jgi:hypothetical protein